MTGIVNDAGNAATYAYDASGNISSVARGNAAVSILGFSPGSGAVGSNVTISGCGFSATPSQNTVQINGAAGTVISASSTQLVVQVPAAATNGPISVTSPSGSATSSASFAVTQSSAPLIGGFSPTIGTPGTAVSVSGSNFQTTVNENSLVFNTRTALLSAATATSLTTAVPTFSTSGRLAVTTPFGQTTSSQDFYVPPGAHVVSDVAVTGRMAIGSSQTVSLTTAGKIGLILFDGTAGQRVGLQTTSSSFGSCGTGSLQILGPGGSSLGSTALCNGNYLTAVTLPTTATYTILVAPIGTMTGSVTFTLYDVPADAAATIVPGGSAVTLTTTTPGQSEVLTFSGTSTQRVSLTLSEDSGLGSDCTYISIANPDGTFLVPSTLLCSRNYYSNVLTLPATGTYTIKLRPYGTNKGSGTFTLYNVARRRDGDDCPWWPRDHADHHGSRAGRVSDLQWICGPARKPHHESGQHSLVLLVDFEARRYGPLSLRGLWEQYIRRATDLASDWHIYHPPCALR
ncbi:protein containing ipt/tig domains (cell surface receptor) [Cupriavidus basilensis OR16]|uniref:Protein containing ipt/tig domains (Cell surface receptor) n=1 Tax=Cupriavidus basilensis OR16 TaxID=1127483 RepID=H1S025_9BURK|nr:protein containing ipt/tig domains (cell surface receptor) [Cupriavidus basilensis OR16]